MKSSQESEMHSETENRKSSGTATSVFFRLFTKESLAKIERRIAEENELAVKRREKAQKRLDEEATDVGTELEQEDEDQDANNARVQKTPNPGLEAGKQLPKNLGDFPPELFGKPIEDIDDFYETKRVRTRTLFQ